MCHATVALEVHIIQMAFWLSVATLLYYGLGIRQRVRRQLTAMALYVGPAGRTATLVDTVLAVGCVITFAIILYNKIVSSTLVVLLQPCHIMCLLYAVALRWPNPQAGVYTNVLLTWELGAWGALVLPETEGMDLPLEKEIYWIEVRASS